MIVQTIKVNDCTPQTIVIGRRGTYDTLQIAFDLSYLVESYGNGVAVLAVKRSQDESAYPAVTSQEDDLLLWTVSETDTFYVGAGEAQLMWYVDGGLAKTIIYPMVVMKDILMTSEEAPDAYQTWVDDLTALGAETLQNAQNAAQSASDAEDAKDDAVTAKESAENAQEGAEAAQQAAETAVTHYPKIVNSYWYVWTNGEWVNTGVKAEGVDGRGIVSVIGQKMSTVGNVDTYTMTVAYTSGNPDTFTFTVTNGVDGYSPVVTITAITGGHRVTITDETHPTGQSFDVMDGEDSAVLSVAGKTGNVTLNANDVAFSETVTYDDGTVGKELSNQKNAIGALGDYEVVDTISDLLISSKDVVFVKDNNGVWGSGISYFYEKHNDWTFGGYVRNNGDRMYPRISEDAPVKHFNAHNWIDVALTWFGRDTLVHDGNNSNGLFAANCVPVDGKYDFDCSEFVGSVLLGITYDNSRYVGGTDSSNHQLNYIGVTSFPPSNSPDRVNGGLLANEMARFFAEQGLLYAIPQNLTQDAFQPGDVLFFKGATTAPTFYQNINHVAIIVDTIKDNVIVAESSGNPDDYGYGTTPIITRKITANSVRSGCIAFARPNYHAPASNQSIRDYLKTGHLTGLMLIGTGVRISASDATLTQGEVNSQGNLRMAASKAFIPVSAGEKIVYTGTPSFGRGTMFCRVVEYDESYNYLGYYSICSEGTAGSRVIPEGTAYIRFWIGFSNQDGVLTIPDIDNNVRVSIGDLTDEVSDLSNAISQKQDATNYVTLSGTVVTQTGADNTMYLCGELAELTFTAPATGITAVRFTSGTTPTVVTLNGITMPDDWSGAEASTTYEINVLNGYGVYQKWT